MINLDGLSFAKTRLALEKYTFFYKNKLYKNNEAEIGQKIRTN